MAKAAQKPIPPAENAPTSSALPPSTTSQDPARHPVFNNSLPRSFLSCRSRKSGKPPLHSLGIFGKIPKDLSSFLRTGSLSRHDGKLFQDAAAKLGHSGYADSPEPSSGPGSAHLRNMFSTTTDAAEERPTRKLKKENRFYNFLTRSRSRSRSKRDHSPHRNRDSIPQVPQNGNAQVLPDSKPPYRVPSRPLSSTTTATNATITPGTPKAKRNPQSSIPIPSASRPENSTNRSRPNTPSQSTSNRRKINIFGISISGPRRPSLSSSKSRSRSHSRPGTPRASVDVPPLPVFGFEEDARGPQHAPHPQPSSRPSSPFPADPRPDSAPPSHDPPSHVNETNGDAHAGSSKLRDLFSGRDSSRSRHQNSLVVPANLVSAPVKRVSSIQRRSLKATTSRPTSPADPRSSSPPGTSVPGIVQTTTAPVRAATVPGGLVKPAAPTSRSGYSLKGRSLDIGHRYRGTMDVVDEEGRFSKEIKAGPPSSKGKEREIETSAPRNSISSRLSTSVRNTKHGSFDFERPSLGAIAMRRSGSGGSSNTIMSGWGRDGVENNTRESALGPGLAGVGTIQREVSMKRGKEREESAKQMEKQGKKVVLVEEPESSPKPNPSPAHSSNGHQTPPSGTTSGKSSSLSKASGRRFFGKGLSPTRGNTHHGLFSFEPPVPSPTWSTASAGPPKENPASRSRRSEKEREKERPRKEKERSIEKKPPSRRDRSPVPVPLPNAGHRSGVKGRSLDLNLGLAWAPSKVREDALLPSSTLFARSISNSSSTRSPSDSRNSSAHGHDPASSRTEELTTEEKSKIGRETADLFKKILGEARYMRFKTYIYQFDAHEIPFDGPTGIISKVDSLLATVPTLGFDEKRRLMDKLVRVILQNA